MLENVKADSTRRITELRQLLMCIDSLQRDGSSTIPPVVPRQVKILQGLFFVHLYAVHEFTVTTLVQNTISYISSQSLPTNSYKPLMLSIILDQHCNSLEAGNCKKQWTRRKKLFKEFDNNNVLPIDNTILPTSEGNLDYYQLQSVIEVLCMSCSPVPDNSYIGFLRELVDHRNAISHGRESPLDIGERYTISDLEKRFDKINTLCEYLIEKFSEYLNTESFKKPK